MPNTNIIPILKKLNERITMLDHESINPFCKAAVITHLNYAKMNLNAARWLLQQAEVRETVEEDR